MKYSESPLILERIHKAEKILLNCHRNPDSDSVACATTLAAVLRSMGKNITIICPSNVPPELEFLIGEDIVQKVDFDDYKYQEYDLFIMCDTGGWQMVMSSSDFTRPQVPIIVIDNHETNPGYGDLNLLDFQTSSVAEILYWLLEDWQISIDATNAQRLLAGIVGDTGSFQYELYKDTLKIANTLVDHGAEMKQIVLHLFNTRSLDLIEFWGVVISHLQIDPAGFAWSAIPYEKHKKYMHIKSTKETAASYIIARVAETDFGFVLTEDEPNICTISFRNRTEVNVADIAVELGGGGHPGAAGARIEGKNFDEAVKLLLTICRKHSIKN